MAGISIRQVKNRIRSMESTRQITRAMELVASSKLRQAQRDLMDARPCFALLADTMAGLAASPGISSPYLRLRAGTGALYVILGGDRGLAGGYYSGIRRLAAEQMAGGNPSVIPIGKKTLEWFRGQQHSILTEAYAEAGKLTLDDCMEIGRLLAESFRTGRFDRVVLLYTRYDSPLSQTPLARQVLPLSPAESAGAHLTTFEPSPEDVLEAIIPEYLGGMVYGALCEARCAEQAARRIAMDTASGNAEDRIAQLRRTANQARQATITQELTEIVAGFPNPTRS